MKGIAVPYIIAIILGITVVFLVGAAFFSSSGDLQKQSCQNKLSTYCTVWRGGGYQTEPSGGWETYAPECSNVGISGPNIGSECDEVLGKGTTTSPTTTKKGLDEECNSADDCNTGLTCKESRDGKTRCLR
ncbi:MAG: hypothetical protein HY361_03690 [Candidatus Aenigmarchaeota archaeon]|nr:hypothetical protein [Candidatus Aenigmarchaeota archaeon]